MKVLLVAALLALAACVPAAPEASPAPRVAAPTMEDMTRAVAEEMAAVGPADDGLYVEHLVNVTGLSCRPAEDGCFQCEYDVSARRSVHLPSGPVTSELNGRRASMACNAAGLWTIAAEAP